MSSWALKRYPNDFMQNIWNFESGEGLENNKAIKVTISGITKSKHNTIRIGTMVNNIMKIWRQLFRIKHKTLDMKLKLSLKIKNYWRAWVWLLKNLISFTKIHRFHVISSLLMAGNSFAVNIFSLIFRWDCAKILIFDMS